MQLKSYRDDRSEMIDLIMYMVHFLTGLKSATAHLHAPALRVPPQKARRWGAELDGMSLVVPAATMGDPSSLEGMILLLEANE